MKQRRNRFLAGVMAMALLLNNMSTLAYAVDEVVAPPPETVEAGPSAEEAARQAEEEARLASEAEAAAQAQAEAEAAARAEDERLAAEEAARQAAEQAAAEEAARQAAEQKAAEEQAEKEAEEVATSSNAGAEPGIDEPVTAPAADAEAEAEKPAGEPEEPAEPEVKPAELTGQQLTSAAGVGVDAVLPEGTKLNVSAGNADAAAEAIAAVLPEGYEPADVQVWDITRTDAEGNTVQPQGGATVTLPAAPERDSAVYYIHDGAAEHIADLAAGQNSFTVEHFSTYAVAAQAPVEPEEEDETEEEPEDEPADISNAGIALMAGPGQNATVTDTVYLYVQLTGDGADEFMKTFNNGSGYITVGKLEDVEGFKRNATHNGLEVTEDYANTVKQYINSHKDSISIYNQDIWDTIGADPNDIDWSQGVLVAANNGANGYLSANTECWHLDGKLEIHSEVTVTVKYVDENNNEISTQEQKQYTVHIGGTYSEEHPDIAGYEFVEATGDPTSGRVTGVKNIEIVFHYKKITPSLTVKKTADKTTGAALNDVITYTITVTNNGNVNVSNITVADRPTGLNQSVGTLAPNASTSVTTTHTIDEADILAGSFVNTATATGTDPKGGEVTGTGTATVETVGQAPALTVKKTADKTTDAALNDEIPYTITVTNSGNVTVSNIIVTDPLTGLEESAGTLAPNASTSVTTIYTVTKDDIKAGSFVNTATAAGTAPNGGEVTASDDETVTTVQAQKELTVTKTLTNGGTGEDGAFKAGETAEFDITVTNTGNVTQKNVTVSEMEGAAIVEGTGYAIEDGKAVIAEIDPGETVTVKATYTVTQDDIDSVAPIANTATVTGEGVDHEESTADIPTEEQAPGLSVTKRISGSSNNGYKAGDTVNFNIHVENTGNVTLKGVLVSDELDGAVIVDGNGYVVGNGFGRITELAPGAEVTVKARYTVTEADLLSGIFTNVAHAQGTAPDSSLVEGENSVRVLTETANTSLTVEKNIINQKADGFKTGDTIKYDIKVTNNGNVALYDVEIKDDLTEETWTIDKLDARTARSFQTQHTVTEKEMVAGELVNTATATGKTADGKPVPQGVDSATADMAAVVTGLTVEKTADKATAKVGETITYTVTVTNTGNVSVSSITVRDDMLGYRDTIEDLAVGSKPWTKELTYTVTAEDYLAGENIVNKANVIGKAANKETLQGEAEVSTQITADEELIIEKAVPNEKELYTLGSEVQYQIKVTNKGQVPLRNVIVKDEHADNFDGKEKDLGTLIPGGVKTVSAAHTITEEDIRTGGTFTNVATAEADPVRGEAGSVKAEPAEAEVNIPKPTYNLSLDKVTTSTAPEGGYKLGDIITYRIDVQSTGSLPVQDVEVTDPLTNLERAIGKLDPGQSVTFTTQHTVTEDDILANRVVNTATATGKDYDNNDVTDTDSVTDAVEAPNNDLTVAKDVDVNEAPANGTAYVLGEAIDYTITVTNKGNLTVSNITVTDAKTGLEETIGTLKPGESKRFATTYTVTAADLGPVGSNGTFVNVAEATGTSADNTKVTGTDSATVPTVPTPPTPTTPTTPTNPTPTDPTPTDPAPTVPITTPDDPGTPVVPGPGPAPVVPGVVIPDDGTPLAGGPDAGDGDDGDAAGGMVIDDDDTPLAGGPTDGTVIEEGETPLGLLDDIVENCCILHLLIMLAALAVAVYYTHNRKKHQQKQFDMRREMGIA